MEIILPPSRSDTSTVAVPSTFSSDSSGYAIAFAWAVQAGLEQAIEHRELRLNRLRVRVEGGLLSQRRDDLVLRIWAETFKTLPSFDPVDGGIDLYGVLLEDGLAALSVVVEQCLGLGPKLDDALPRPIAREVLRKSARAIMQRLRRRQRQELGPGVPLDCVGRIQRIERFVAEIGLHAPQQRQACARPFARARRRRAQRVASSISFDIRETVAWDADSNTFAAENNRRRQADVYVFALLAHRTKETLNPLDVSQWDFFLLDTSILNQHARKQRRISLERLVALDALRCPYSELRSLIEGVEARRYPSQL